MIPEKCRRRAVPRSLDRWNRYARSFV